MKPENLIRTPDRISLICKSASIIIFLYLFYKQLDDFAFYKWTFTPNNQWMKHATSLPTGKILNQLTQPFWLIITIIYAYGLYIIYLAKIYNFGDLDICQIHYSTVSDYLLDYIS